MSAPVDVVLSTLDKVKKSGKGWLACCPAHDDRSPSLSIAEGDDGRVLLHCYAGCDTRAVVESAGLKMADLFPEGLSLEVRQEYQRRSADSTPFGHSAHADPDTCSTIIRTGSRSAATQGLHC